MNEQENVILPEEVNKRRRVFQLAEEVHGLLERLDQCFHEGHELGANTLGHRDEIVQRLLSMQIGKDGEIEVPPQPLERSAMPAILDRLFAEAPKLKSGDGTPDTNQRPAVICHVLLRGQLQPLHGSLSTTPEGALRMMFPAQVDNGPKRMMEMFFDYDDVLSVMVERDIKLDESRIHRPS